MSDINTAYVDTSAFIGIYILLTILLFPAGGGSSSYHRLRASLRCLERNVGCPRGRFPGSLYLDLYLVRYAMFGTDAAVGTPRVQRVRSS
eukprot:1677766-Rhodomonas_salina.1